MGNFLNNKINNKLPPTDDSSIFPALKYEAIEKAALIARDALLEESLSIFFFPNPNTRPKKLLKFLQFQLEIRWKSCVITSPAMEGWIIWERPHEHLLSLTMKELFLSLNLALHLGLPDFHRMLHYYNYMLNLRSQLIQEPYWYCDCLVIHPNYQGHSLGRRLMEHYLTMIDKEKASAFLEAQNPRAIQFYERLGFQTVQTFVFPGSNIKTHFMLRKPHPLLPKFSRKI